MDTQGECRDDPQFLVGAAVLGVSVVAGVIRDIVAVDEVHELPGPTDRGSVLVVEVNVGFGVEVSFRAFREAIAPIGAVVGFGELPLPTRRLRRLLEAGASCFNDALWRHNIGCSLSVPRECSLRRR